MISDWIISALVCISVFLLGIYAYVTRNFSYWTKISVKELKPTFPFGNIAPCIFLKTSVHEFLNQIYQKGEGEKMIGFYVFDKPYLILRDPELLRSVFIKDFNLFSNKLISDNKTDPYGTNVLFTLVSPPWKHIRQKMTPMFTSGKLKKNFDLMLEIYQDLDKYLNDLQISDKIEQSIEIKEICAKLMTDLIGITAYNVRFNSLTNSNADFRKFGKSIVQSQLLRYLQMSAILFVPALRYISNAKFFNFGTGFFENTFSEIIDERIKSGATKSDFVDLVIEMTKKEEKIEDSNEYRVNRGVWASQLAGIFLAGFETSSTASAFAIYELATHPKIQERLRNELLQALNKTNGKLTYEMITTLPYLNMVIRETLRLYPILSWVDRLPEIDYTFPGTTITIKKGTPIIFPIRSMQMNPKFFPNPEEFDPERFSDENKNDIIPFTYAPFGEGPRNCIGSRLGLLQTKLAVAYFFSKYEVTPCKKTLIPMEIDRRNVFIRPSGEIYLNFRKLPHQKL